MLRTKFGMNQEIDRFLTIPPRKECTNGLHQGQILDALNTGAAIPAYAARHNQTWNLSASKREDLAGRASKV